MKTAERTRRTKHAALLGTERVQPIGARFPRVHRVTVRYGEPLDFARYEGLGGSTVIRRAVTDEVMAAILTMTGQEWAGEYNQRQPDLPA